MNRLTRFCRNNLIKLGLAGLLLTAGCAANLDKPQEKQGRASEEARAILFSSKRDGADHEIYSIDTNKRIRRLTYTEDDKSNPSVSTDGRLIAYDAYNEREGARHIYIMETSGSGLRQLTFGRSSNMHPSWYKNQEVAFSSDRMGNYDIYSISIDSSNEERLTNGSTNEVEACWFQQDRKIAYCQEEIKVDPEDFFRTVSWQRDIYLLRIGETPKKVTNTGRAHSPTVSSNGKSVAYINEGGLCEDVFLTDAEGKIHVNLTKFCLAEKTQKAISANPCFSSNGLICFEYSIGGEEMVNYKDADGNEAVRFIPSYDECGIAVVDTEGNLEKILVSNRLLYTQPAWLEALNKNN